MKLKDSKTFVNLARAYMAECSARTRYEFCEYGFRYNGYEAIATLIDKIAYQEFNHARVLYTKLQDGEMKLIDNIDVCAGFPFKEKWDLETNLSLLCQDELDEAHAYEEFETTAREEGFTEIAVLFEKVAAIEKMHEERYRKLLANVKEGLVFSRDEDMIWECGNCGHIVIGKKAPELCPVCKHPKSYFKIHATNF